MPALQQETDIQPAACDCGSIISDTRVMGRRGGDGETVYAMGMIGYAFQSEAARDSFAQNMPEGETPYNPQQFLNHLNDHPYEAAGVIWTLVANGTPIYAVRPVGSFSGVSYKQLQAFLAGQIKGEIRNVSIPGIAEEDLMLMSGAPLPVLIPDVRGLAGWSKNGSVNQNLLSHLLFELAGGGRTPDERAAGYAATFAYQNENMFESVSAEGLGLQKIEVSKSLVCRSQSECRDVKFTFFNPAGREKSPKKIYLYTVDVSNAIPVVMGGSRSWRQY